MTDRAGFAPSEMPGTCCLPDDPDGGDAGDGGPDGGGDASVGICAGESCGAGCSCGVLPSDGLPHCLCAETDAGTNDSGTALCGVIYCFAGCSCENASESRCGCP